MHPDVGHKWGSYSNFILAFPTSVMFGSSMPFATGIGWVYPALGWGISVHVEFLIDSNHPPCISTKGPVCKGDIPTLLESGHDARRLEWYACICFAAGGPPPDPPLSSTLMGWEHSQCSSPTKVGSSSDPQSRAHPWNVGPVILMFVVRLRKMTCQGLLLRMAGSSSARGARLPQM